MKYIIQFKNLLNYSLVQLVMPLSIGLLLFSLKVSAATLNELMSKYKISSQDLGLIVQSQNKVQLQHNIDKKFIPASISKLLTTYGVLKGISPQYKFKTELYLAQNNLYLVGGGDPSFVSENLWYLVNEFHRQGIKEIKGHIVVDDSLFDQVRFDTSRESKRVDRSYDSPVGAMSFNWNSVNIFVRPALKAGEKAHVVVDPESTYFSLFADVVTVKKVKKELIIDVDQARKKISVKGEVLLGAPEKAYFKNVADPIIWSGENLKAFLLQRGIKVQGQVIAGKYDGSGEKVASYESKNLSLILADMNKFSNNYVAEMLTKNIAAVQGEKKATLKTGVEYIKNQLLQLKLKSSDFEIYNPSGFTRENQISAEAMNKVLEAIQNDFRYFPVVLESLPIAGVDGTLKKRMKNSVAEGFVRAKTGYLDNVVTLAGYAGRGDGAIYRFSFLYNGPQDEAQVREFFDQVLISLLE